MLGEMSTAGYRDAGAGKAIEELKAGPKPVSGPAMQDMIIKATADLDGQAAGTEFADVRKYAMENWNTLSPDAKAKFAVYEKFAHQAQARGQTGIQLGDYAKMIGQMSTTGYRDTSAGAAIETAKRQPTPLSGDNMEKLIKNATADLDNQAAGTEYSDLKQFVNENWNKLSPDAKAKFSVYEKYAQASQAKGQTGIPVGDYNKMLGEMRTAGAYRDAGAGAAIEDLKRGPQPVSGDAMKEAIIKGTADLDGQAAGKEFADFKQFATDNWASLSPDAKAQFRTYEKYANQAQANGQSGIQLKDYAKMIGEMNAPKYRDAGAGAALEALNDRSPGRISGQSFEKAIIDGTRDLDGQAAGREYADIKKFAEANWDRMSPAAQQKFAIYSAYAETARAQGQTGIAQGDYDRMVAQMRRVGGGARE